MKSSDGLFRVSGPQRIVLYFVLCVLAIPPLLPLAWMISTSLKTDAQIFPQAGKSVPPISLRSLIPDPVKPQNYSEALKTVPFATYLRNTLLLCALTVIGAVLSSATVAYGFARMEFWGKGALFLVMISTMALPAQVTMIPVFSLFRALGWYGTYLPLFVPACFAAPFYVFLLTQFYRSLPMELSEAARVDGANEWTIFARVLLPLSKPALATCALFQFLHTWNDFLGPLLYLNDPSRYTLAYGLQQFTSAYGGKWSQLMAAATIFTLPIIVLFFLAQRYFVQGIVLTGMK